MTLTRELRRVGIFVLMLLAISALMVAGNQRHAQAQSLGEDIICNDVDPALGDLPFDPDTCDDTGGGDTGGDEDNNPIPPIPPQCFDGQDNDGDGFVDWAPPGEGGDPDCKTPTDDSEAGNTPPPPEDVCPNDAGIQTSTDDCTPEDTGGDTGGSSSGGGGGGGSHRNSSSGSGGEVLGAASDTSISCDLYLTEFIRFGGANNPEQVTRLQSFLNTYEGMVLPESGVYDDATLAAVHAFQKKYAGDILAPWGATRSTGFVYLTTRKKVNELRCNKLFPLSSSEEQEINTYRARAEGSALVAPGPAFPAQVVLPAQELPAAAAAADVSATDNESRGGIWDAIKGFFGRIFGRSR